MEELTLEQKIRRAAKQRDYRRRVKYGRAVIDLECDKTFKKALIKATKGEDSDAMNRLLSDPKINRLLSAIIDSGMMLITYNK